LVPHFVVNCTRNHGPVLPTHEKGRSDGDLATESVACVAHGVSGTLMAEQQRENARVALLLSF